MKTGQSMNELFERAVTAVRDEPVGEAAMTAARGRVLEQLTARLRDPAPAVAPVAPLRGCPDIRALFPRYRARGLDEPQELLVQDHLRECLDCHRVFTARGVARLAGAPAEGRPVRLPRMALAAALLVVVGGVGWFFRGSFTMAPSGPRAVLESAEGAVYLLSPRGEGAGTVAAGAQVGERQWLRTPRNTRATVRLRDGSRVEMREHTELSVTMSRHDVTVHLERGSIIVRAAPRQEGHLMVETDDATAMVTGTIFSVTRGTKGSRISVIEGSVQVDGRSGSRVLTAGQQLSTQRDVQALAIREEIAWSPQVEQYAGLLREMKTLDDQLEAVRWPELRYASPLLAAVPAGTLALAALPNAGGALEQVHQLFQDRLAASPVLQRWWGERGGAELEPRLAEVVARVRALSSFLGDELVIALGEREGQIQPLLLASVRQPGLRAALEPEVQSGRIAIVGAGEDPPGARRPELVVMISGTTVAVAPDRAWLRALRPEQDSGFAASAFGQRVAGCYRDGVGVLLAADLAGIASRQQNPAALLHELGADTAQYLIVAQGKVRGESRSRATVSFSGPRQGMASWLAAPAPMGSLDFITPGASFAAAFVVKEPARMLDDVFRVADTMQGDFRAHLQALQARLGVELRGDLAGPLGSDVAVAIDGPLLPVPSWKVVLQVNDPARLMTALDRVLAEVNRELTAHGQQPLRLDHHDSRGRTVWTVSQPGGGPGAALGVRWLFADGYMVVAPSDEQLQRAVRARDSNFHLRGSERFRSLTPPDRQANFSALVYHNLGQAGAAVADWLAGGNALRPEQRLAIERFAASAHPALVYAYGDEREIQVASSGGFFGLSLDHVLASASLSDLLPSVRAR
jgi:hypothetical protein